ncbi:hypothetical protein DER44DRAFT_875375 [Fusarium oxysporum]|nr:hypothetical protein DER44DRAFT_875375 [Fusarium oxysporum]
MSKLDRFTLFIDDDEANLIQLRNGGRKELPEEVPENRGKRSRAGQTEQPPAKRFPVKRSDSNTLIPVVFRSPWKHYMKRYTVRHWCLFVVGTGNNRDKQPFIILTPTWAMIACLEDHASTHLWRAHSTTIV